MAKSKIDASPELTSKLIFHIAAHRAQRKAHVAWMKAQDDLRLASEALDDTTEDVLSNLPVKLHNDDFVVADIADSIPLVRIYKSWVEVLDGRSIDG